MPAALPLRLSPRLPPPPMTSPGRLSPARLDTSVLSIARTARRPLRQVAEAPQNENAELLQTFEALGHAVLAMDRWGRVAYQTSTLQAMLAAEADADVVRAAMQRVADGLFVPVLPLRQPASASPDIVRTPTGVYLLRGVLHPGARGPGGQLAVVSVQRTAHGPRTAAELRELYALTGAESSIAMLLAEGRSNAGIAAARGISPHTARRHTERVLHKLGVRSRAEVARRLMD